MTIPTLLNSTSPTALMRATPIERAMGRFMRAEDHGAAPAASPAPSPTPTPAPAASEGGAAAEAGAAAAVAAEAGKEGDQVTSIAGGAGAGKEGAEGEAKPAGEAGKEGEEGAGEKAPTILGAPEAYDVKAPEGLTFDKEAFDAVEPILREMDLSNDAAQKLVGAYAEKVVPLLIERGKTQAEQAQADAGAKLRKEWADAARADPEIGGANFDKMVDSVATVWQQFGIAKDTGFRQLLDDSGLGNHPDMLRFLSRVGKAVGEGSFVPPGGAGSGERKSDKEVFYGATAS